MLMRPQILGFALYLFFVSMAMLGGNRKLHILMLVGAIARRVRIACFLPLLQVWIPVILCHYIPRAALLHRMAGCSA